VIAIVIMLGGVAGIRFLSVAQYPDVAPVNVLIRLNYPGASAEVLEASVTQVIEQQLTGLPGMLYFTSTSASSGLATIVVTFDKGIDADIAQVQVQNKLQQALPRLPQEVQQQGVTVTKSNPDFLAIFALYDESNRTTTADISDYLVSNLQDPISRLPGVGEVRLLGAPYAMRIWLDPFKLASFNLVPADVIAAIQAQNVQVAAGELGAQPSPPEQQLNATVTAQSRLTSPEQFRAIVLKTLPSGANVTLAQVGRVEIGSESYVVSGRVNRHPASGLQIYLAPGADALKTSDLLHAEVERLSKDFPPGYRYQYPNEAAPFIRISIEEVVKTLLEAIILVVIVMFVFLHSWRATLIPAIAVPVVLLGTFGVLGAAGYSINTLTLFGMVLSIGLLVDDAIVVVENVERVMAENPGMSAREATIISMDQVQIALIAIALVLSAVFLPMAFFGGSVGVIYRQFSITLISSMVLSVVVALVLSPALAATLLKPPHEAGHEGNAVDRALARFGDRFNAFYERVATRYQRAVRVMIDRMRLASVGYAALCAVLVVVFTNLPTGFLPAEDQGRGQVLFTLPPGATVGRTMATAQTIEDYFLSQESKNLRVIYSVVGNNPTGVAQNNGAAFLGYIAWSEREGADRSAQAIAQRATRALGGLRDVQFSALNPPPIRGLGASSGFTMELLNTGGLSRDEFKDRRDALLAAARADPVLANVRLNALEEAPALHVDVDTAKAGALGVTQADINSLIGAAWGGRYVNDFIDRGRVKRVYVQGDAPFRGRPEDLADWFVRTGNGTMTSLSAFATSSWTETPRTLQRFNGVSSFEFQGDAAAGHSSGQAMERIAELAARLPGVSVDWSGLSYQERLSGQQAPLLYAVSLLVVFLCLAALYESWSIPLSVMLVVPLGLIGATIAVAVRGLPNDIFFQVGLLTTMGLSAKNAILIVEFAELAERRGKSPLASALEAARLRLRPILMTSFAFMFGVLPLAVATGAGAQSRIAIGTTVVGGILTATVLAIFFVPLFFVLVRRLFGGRGAHADGAEIPA
jgi:multidrug efflux pump